MNILFRADASSSIGTGHIMRDLVLAQQYPSSKIFFATQELKGNLNSKIIEAGYQLEVLSSNDIDELDALIQKYSIEMLIIDHYDIGYEIEKELKTRNPSLTILVVDDTYERHHCDILLNHNISGDAQKYKGLVPDSCELRCGVDYTLLREEFHKEKKSKTVFVAMGGTDYGNLNISILEVLKKFDDINTIVVTTEANPYLKELQTYIEDKKWIELHINSNNIAKLMKISDFAIVTPSVTVNEVYFMELPLIAITVAPNQEGMAKYLKENGFLIIDKFYSNTLESFIMKMIKRGVNNGI